MDGLIHGEFARLHANVCSGLADPKRIMIFYSLAKRPRNITGITSLLDLPQPTVSCHLKILRERGKCSGRHGIHSNVRGRVDHFHPEHVCWARNHVRLFD